MNKEPILVILAAGMGSRYGGLKQIDTVGTNGESIIDFSIYDAIRAGFKRLVLIIREEHKEAFIAQLTHKIEDKIQVEFAFQDINDIPSGFKVDPTREKPLGTTHALLACRNICDAPFMICNADDYYGPESFKIMYEFLKNEANDNNYCMVGYPLENTLTDNGSVTRGVCQEDNGILQDVVEIQKIQKNDGVMQMEEDGKWVDLPKDALASMNYWGFTPNIFKQCESVFADFLKENLEVNPLKCEHVIPTAVKTLLESKLLHLNVFKSNDKWFGVTYKEDKPSVVENLKKYKDEGLYPFDLWK